MKVRWRSATGAIVLLVACGPEGAAGDSGADASSGSGPTSGTEGGSTTMMSSSLEGTTTLGSSAGDVTDDESGGETKFDFPIADLPMDQCPLEPRGNAPIGGASPLGQVFATQ